MTYLNVTLRRVDYINKNNELIANYGISSLFLIGMVGNLFALTMMIYRRLFVKTPIFIFFLFMTLMDTIKVGTEGGLVFVRRWIYHRPIKEADANNIHGLSFILVRYFGDTAMLASPLILIYANLYKFYAIVRPLKFNPTKVAFPYLSCIITIAALYLCNIPFFWFYTLKDIRYNTTVYTILWFVPKYKTLVDGYLIYAFVVYSVIPGISLTIVSIGIIAAFYRSYRKHVEMMNSGKASDTKETSTYSSAKLSIMSLLPLSVVHIACSLASVLELRIKGTRGFGYEMFMLLILNHTINVYVQMAFSRFYRNALLGRQ